MNRIMNINTKELADIVNGCGENGKYIILLPAIIYGIDKLYNLFNDVMDKGYECSFDAEEKRFSLKKDPDLVS